MERALRGSIGLVDHCRCSFQVFKILCRGGEKSEVGVLELMPPPRSHYIVALTSLRGLLALWVVLFHFWNDLLVLLPSLKPLQPLAQRGDFAVPGFFVLSGFVLARNHLGEFDRLDLRKSLVFLGLRLGRIYPVHFVTLLAVLLMVTLARARGLTVDHAGYSLSLFVSNLLLVQAWSPQLQLGWNFPAWSISCEWAAYLTFPLLALLISRYVTKVLTARVWFAAAAVTTVAVYLAWPSAPFHVLMTVFPTFIAGMTAERLVFNHSRSKAHLRGLAEACAVVIIGACFVTNQLALAITLIALQFLVPALASGSAISSWFWEAKPLVWLGDVSYSLYMTHTLALKITNRVLPSATFATRSDWTKLLVLVGYICLVAVLCLASYVLVERPARQWGRNLLKRSSRVRGARGGYLEPS
jgi:peptidoglycan/LPS O-acetylase OafA/YrhL